MPLDINLVSTGHEETSSLLHEIPQEQDLLGVELLHVGQHSDLGIL